MQNVKNTLRKYILKLLTFINNVASARCQAVLYYNHMLNKKTTS